MVILWRDILRELAEPLEEKRYAVGQVAHRKRGDFVKVRDGEWQQVIARAPGTAPSPTVKPSIEKLHRAVQKGDLAPGISLGDHIRDAKQVIHAHKKSFRHTLLAMQDLSPPGARVEGRIKKVDSLLEKLPRRAGMFKKAHDIPDTTGIRIICKNVAQVRQTADKVRAKYDLFRNDAGEVQDWDYLDKPLGDWKYRSHHLYFNDKDGLTKELQIRTENQDKFASWCHTLYKPKTPAQLQVLATHKDDIDTYARSMSEHFWALDNGKKSVPPSCPPAVQEHFGCLT
jgi:ppGpp synthetase/RelA/SpoT-type nucleotidyltranferase